MGGGTSAVITATVAPIESVFLPANGRFEFLCVVVYNWFLLIYCSRLRLCMSRVVSGEGGGDGRAARFSAIVSTTTHGLWTAEHPPRMHLSPRLAPTPRPRHRPQTKLRSSCAAAAAAVGSKRRGARVSSSVRPPARSLH